MGADHGDDDPTGAGRPEELAGLARQFVDLWQDQMASSLADPQMAEALGRLTAMWGGAASAMMTALAGVAEGKAARSRTDAGQTGGSGTHDRQAGAEAGADIAAQTGTTAGAAAAMAASGAGGDALARIVSRLEAVEARLAALEGAAGKRSGSHRPKAG